MKSYTNSSKKFVFNNTYDSIIQISKYLSLYIKEALNLNKQIIILCIGTDRSTGDSLGPIVGEKLKLLLNNKVFIYGNLKNPVHAKNIKATIDEIYCNFKSPFIIAIDASLGDINNVGNIIIEEGPLNPGAALNKSLPIIGDISIKGIVNIYSPFDFFILQNTRLFTVINLADIISKSIYKSVKNSFKSEQKNINISFQKDNSFIK